MARAAFVTYLFALSISSTIGSLNDCAIGPEYWCKSFENAQDCGAIQHCTDTVWSTDEKYTKVESTVTCQICQKIFMKTHEGLGENEDFVKPNLLKACDLLPSDNFRSKCTKIVNDYGSSIISLMKKQRFATICHLVDGCTRENKASAVVVGQSRCTWGPSYWCSSLRNSRDCQATEHCLNQIWSQQTIQTKNGDNVCQYCINIINKLNTIITDSKIKVDAKTWLDDMCNTLPGKDAIDQCKQLANEYTEEIVDLLKNTIDPSVICHLGSMCEDVTVTSRDTKITEQSRMLCNSIVRATHDLYRNEQKSQSEIEEYLKNDCQQMTTDELKQKCIDMVENYGSNIFGNVVDDTKLSAICDKIVFESLFETRCDQCQSVISSANRMLNNEHSKDEVLQHIDDKLCSRLDGNQKLNCQTMLDTNERFDSLTIYGKQIDPQQICENLHFCSNLIAIDSCSTCIERVNLQQQAVLQGIDRLAGYFIDDCQHISNKECQIFVKEIKDSLQELINSFDTKDMCTEIGFCDQSNPLDFNDYEKSIENKINKGICSSLGPFQTLCQHILHGNLDEIQHLQLRSESNDLEQFESGDKCKYCIARVQRRKYRMKFIGDSIFRILIHSCHRRQRCRRAYRLAKARFDARIRRICPYLVCKRFGYCTKPNSTKIQSTIDRTNSTCILCEYVMNYLSNYIHLNSTEEEIEENLEQICDQLPTILQNQCQEYIDDYSPTIISILLNDFNLTTICQKLNLCSNQITNNINHLIKADTTTCGICDYLSTYIYFERQRHSNNNYLSTVCSHLSDEYQTKCQTILQLFSPFINELELSPKKNFCKQLPICEIPMVDLKDAELINEQSNALPKCTICQYVISYLDAALRNNKSQQAIEEALEQVCTILPKVERDQCTQLLKTYGPVIAQLIVDSADPDMICRRVGLCQQSTNDNSKCTLGREYWCANRENAELCNAIDFCEREVWNVVKPLFY